MAISNIGKGAIISYIAIFLNIAISFLYTPWMLKQIGTSDYGLYSLILSFISYFTIDFGLSAATARFITKYRAEGDNKKVEDIMGMMLKIFLGIDTIIFICLFVCYFFISNIFQGLTIEEIEKLKILYIIAGLFSILAFALKPLDGALIAYEYFVPAKIIDMVYKVGSILLIVIALLLGGNIYLLVLINSGLAFLTHLYKYFYWHKKTTLTPNLQFNDADERKSIMFFSGWSFLIGLAQRFRLSLIPSVLGIFSNTEQITLFSLGMVMEAMTWTLSSALNGLLLPKVSRLSHENDEKGIVELMIRVGRIQLFIVSIIFGGFVICGKPFIVLWLGEGFVDVYYIVLCLTCTNLLSNTLQVAVDKVYADNKIKHLSRITFTTSLFGIIFSCIFAKQFGAVGCAFFSGIALFFTQVGYLFVYKKIVNLNITEFLQNCHFKILPLLTVSSILYYILLTYISVHSWYEFAISVVVYTIIFSIISYKFLFNDYEKSLVKSVLRLP